jgi:penicillin-insensitive murein DD-endopeptidase
MRLLHRAAAALSVAFLVLLASGVAGAQPAAGRRGSPVAARDTGKKHKGKGAQSIGAPNSGHLAAGVRLKSSKHLEVRPGANPWGLPVLVRLLRQASDDVARKHKGSMMFVGDLSAKEGGFLKGHNSHQSGRDADVGFYVANEKGKPVRIKHFVAFDGNGKGRELPWAVFDEARNWALVEALLKDEHAGVRYLFITTPLRAKLLAFAARKHAPKDLIARAAAAMMSPEDADLHDDHFHVRLSCPEGMRDVCVEESIRRDKGDDTSSVEADESSPYDDVPTAVGAK